MLSKHHPLQNSPATIQNTQNRVEHTIRRSEDTYPALHRLRLHMLFGDSKLTMIDAFYLQVQILVTVGYGDICPKTLGGKVRAAEN